jgi:hypothetical protein
MLQATAALPPWGAGRRRKNFRVASRQPAPLSRDLVLAPGVPIRWSGGSQRPRRSGRYFPFCAQNVELPISPLTAGSMPSAGAMLSVLAAARQAQAKGPAADRIELSSNTEHSAPHTCREVEEAQ